MKKAKSKGKIGFLGILLLIANVVIAFALVGSAFAPKVNPTINYFPAFLGLAYPLLLYANLALLIIWIMLRRKWFLISLFAILSGFQLIPRFFQFQSGESTLPENAISLTVVSYNIQTFRNFYKHNSIEYLDSLTEFLNTLNPDVICFQEFYNDEELNPSIVNRLKKSLDMPYVYFNKHLRRYNKYEFGLASFSKYRIVNSGVLSNINYRNELYTTNYGIFSDIVMFQDTIRIYNLHLESFKISSDDGVFDAINDGEEGNFNSRSRSLLSKIKQAFQMRAKQVLPIREHIDVSPYPVIVCGDFNDTPSSWAYEILSENLQDAFMEAGSGTGKTYNGRYPSFRIDYILVDEAFEIHDFETHRVAFSDHYPVQTVITKAIKE